MADRKIHVSASRNCFHTNAEPLRRGWLFRPSVSVEIPEYFSARRIGPLHRIASVDGSVRIEAEDRAGRERLPRYCARPPFALDRLRELNPERLRYEVTKPGPGGGGSLLLTPVELIDRIAALVPPPRIHRHRYFRVLARTAAYRKFPLRPRTAAAGRLPPKSLERGSCQQAVGKLYSRPPLRRGE